MSVIAYLVDDEAMRSVLLKVSSFSMPNKSCITLDLFGCPIFAALLEATALLDVKAVLESWFLPDIIALELLPTPPPPPPAVVLVEPALLQAEAAAADEAAMLLAVVVA